MSSRFWKNIFIMLSNLFLGLPVVFASMYHQWLYCFFASGLFIFSPLFHWYRINNNKSPLFGMFKTLDWIFAICAFIYMYYYAYINVPGPVKNTLLVLLTAVVIFFWYGWKKADYGKFHPWFHIIAPIVSSAILIGANIYQNS